MKTHPLTKKRAKEISSLTRRKSREELGLSVVEGFRAVTAALQEGADVVEIVVDASSVDSTEVLKVAGMQDVPVKVAEQRAFGKISDVDSSQGILALVRIQWLSISELRGCRTLIALDGVQDPGNAGTVLRAASWFGIDGVLAGIGTADLYSPKVIRASMGGIWGIKLGRTTNMAMTLSDLRAAGHRIYGADSSGKDVSEWTPAERSCLVMGNEAWGISDDVRAVVDELVGIPGAHRSAGAESLNVAVAAGILMHAWTRSVARTY